MLAASAVRKEAHTVRKGCTKRWRGAAGVVPGGAPPFLFSTLLVPSTLHRAVEIGLLDHQGFTGSMVSGGVDARNPGSMLLGGSMGAGFRFGRAGMSDSLLS